MPTDKRDRAGNQPEQGMQPKSFRDRDPQRILDEQERKQHDQEAHQPNAALRQQPHIGRHADAGKKHQEKNSPGRHVEGDAQSRREAEQGDKDREQHAAHNRLGDIVFRQNTDVPREQRAR